MVNADGASAARVFWRCWLWSDTRPLTLQEARRRDAFLGCLLSAILAVVGLAAAISLIILRHMHISKLHLSLRQLLEQSLAVERSTRMHRLPPSNRTKGIIFGILGIAWLFGFQLIPSPRFPTACEGSCGASRRSASAS